MKEQMCLDKVLLPKAVISFFFPVKLKKNDPKHLFDLYSGITKCDVIHRPYIR